MIFKRIATFLTVLVFSMTGAPAITLADVGDEDAGSFDDPDQIEESESTVDEGDAGAAGAAAAGGAEELQHRRSLAARQRAADLRDGAAAATARR